MDTSALLVRELLLGSRRCNDIHRGLPGISRTLLSARLRRLQVNGLVARVPDEEDRPEYRLTPAGAALEPLVRQFGDWARRWCFGDPEREQLDTARALWRLRQFVRRDRLPARRVVVEFVLHDAGEERAWLVLAPEEASACHRHPGYDTDVWVTTDLAELHRLVAGTSTIATALGSGRVNVDGGPNSSPASRTGSPGVHRNPAHATPRSPHPATRNPTQPRPADAPLGVSPDGIVLVPLSRPLPSRTVATPARLVDARIPPGLSGSYRGASTSRRDDSG
ncbi:winged helix-turn-helix transcriptional regulator [Nocardia abscessus]|uniref:winged helix-turn-helix transcriptional regulator n=1 Tax=Nocardia abscessus TaxID=120957 RepID=UPI001895CC96|nr:winged helix-turn-helix transcriptional regulator [Nocardia abscessus]MBF6339349.1 winged helix-turn-helix transcriptional regulator [Nocardia abscessus]